MEYYSGEAIRYTRWWLVTVLWTELSEYRVQKMATKNCYSWNGFSSRSQWSIVEAIRYSGWGLMTVLRSKLSEHRAQSMATKNGESLWVEWMRILWPPITAPTSNWRFSCLLKICAGIKFSDIFEEQWRKSPTAGSCKTLCDAAGSFKHVSKNTFAATHNGNVWLLMMVEWWQLITACSKTATQHGNSSNEFGGNSQWERMATHDGWRMATHYG